MGLPAQPLTLSPAEVDALNLKLSAMRHDINNRLSTMMAAAELIRMKPDMAPQLAERLLTQPAKITELIRQFTNEFQRTLGITQP